MNKTDTTSENQHLLQDLDRVLDLIGRDKLTKETADQVVQEAIDNYDRHVNPGWLRYRKSVSTNAAYVEWKDEGSCFTDVYGESFLDCLGGFGIYLCGHRNPEILATVEAQLKHQALHSQELLDPLRGYLAKAVASITPGDLQYCFFTNGGAEAVEMALKLARIASGGSWFISAIGGFHGKSMGAISVGGKSTYRTPYLPMIQQIRHVDFGDAEQVSQAIRQLKAVGEKVAAVILEPIQGEAGVIIPPAGYLKAVRRICDEQGVILIFDEIQTGMGRTGTFFRCEAEGVVPDILTYGKAFGGDIMPITGIIARPHLWVQELQDNPWILGSPTFDGNPLACAAALATIRFMLAHQIPQQAAEKGAYLLAGLKRIQADYSEILQDIRGIGLMIAVEFPRSDIGYAVAKAMFARRIMTAGTLNNAKCIRFEPAATMTYDEFDHVLKSFAESVASCKDKV